MSLTASAASTASAEKPLEKLNLENRVELQVLVFTRASFLLTPIKILRLLEQKVEELRSWFLRAHLTLLREDDDLTIGLILQINATELCTIFCWNQKKNSEVNFLYVCLCFQWKKNQSRNRHKLKKRGQKYSKLILYINIKSIITDDVTLNNNNRCYRNRAIIDERNRTHLGLN